KAGAQTITATDTATATTTGTLGVTVRAAAAAHMNLTTPKTATALTPFPVTVTLTDAYGNMATGYRGTVHFKSTDPLATLPPDTTFTAADGGRRQFNVTLATPPGQTISVYDIANSSLGTTSGMIAVDTERAILAPTLDAPVTPTAGILAQALGEVRRRDLAYAATKRTMDLLVAATLLVILLPVFLAVAIAIRLETQGPIFYRGERIGRFGNRFTMVKFRSMRANCDPSTHAAFVRTLLQDGTKCDLYTVPDDPRITRV